MLSRWNSVILAANQMSSSKVLRSLSQAALSYYRCLFIQNKTVATSLFAIWVNTVFQEQDFMLISLQDLGAHTAQMSALLRPKRNLRPASK